jgi:uncharacterized protein YkwD
MLQLGSTTVAIAALFLLQQETPKVDEPDQSETIQLTAEKLGRYAPRKRPNLDAVERLIVERTNEFRRSEKLDPVEADEELTATAEEFAAFMARTDKYGHHADDRSPDERVRAQEYEVCVVAENIAYAFATVGFETRELTSEMVRGWIKSPPHRKNMLNQAVTQIGVGVAQSEATGVFYAVQVFGRPQSQAITFSLRNRSGQTIDYRLGEQSYSLPENFRRTHQLCVPEELRLRFVKEGTSETEELSRTPEDGDEFVINRQDGVLTVTMPPEPEAEKPDASGTEGPSGSGR